MNIIEFVKSNMTANLDLANFEPHLLPADIHAHTWGVDAHGDRKVIKRETPQARRQRWLAILDECNELLEVHGEECSEDCNYFWKEDRADKCDVYREIAMNFKNHPAYLSEWTLKDDAEEQADYYRHVLRTIEAWQEIHGVYSAEHVSA